MKRTRQRTPSRRDPASSPASPFGAPEARTGLDLYLREIGRVPLLTREEELALGRRARDGDEDAVAALVAANQRFAVKIARRYQGRGVPLEDLIGAANEGLLVAARKFDPDAGVKYISYAVWWLRAHLTRTVQDHGRNVRFPQQRHLVAGRVREHRDHHLQTYGQEPGAADMAESLGLTVDEVHEALGFAGGEYSLDAPLGEDDKRTGMDRWGAVVVNPLADVEDAELRAGIERIIQRHLSPREAKVIRLYFGLGGENPYTLEEIGDLLGVTRERIRQIKEKALARIAHPLSALTGRSVPVQAD